MESEVWSVKSRGWRVESGTQCQNRGTQAAKASMMKSHEQTIKWIQFPE